MKHVMHDLETLSLQPDAVILSLGAVTFTPDGLEEPFYMTISMRSQKDRHIDAGTVGWWLQQDKNTLQEAISGKVSLRRVLTEYQTYLRDQKIDGGVWANGADFDTVLLTHAYKSLEMDLPWEYWQSRCYRTIKSVYPKVDIERTGAHHALDDAMYQAKHLIAIAKAHNVPL